MPHKPDAFPDPAPIDYDTVRTRVRDGDLLAWKWRLMQQRFGVVPWDCFTHVAQALWVDGRLCVLEAVMPRVRLVPLSMYTGLSTYWVPLHAAWGPAQRAYAMEQLGDRYSLRDCAVGLWGMPVDDDVEQCAEMSIRLARQAGVDLGDRATPPSVVRAAIAHQRETLYRFTIP